MRRIVRMILSFVAADAARQAAGTVELDQARRALFAAARGE